MSEEISCETCEFGGRCAIRLILAQAEQSTHFCLFIPMHEWSCSYFKRQPEAEP